MLPKDWSIETLLSLATIERGKFSIRPRNDPRYFGGNIPFVQTGDVTNSGRFLISHTQTINELGLAVSKVFPANTILMTIAANIGATALTTYPVACPDSVVGIIARPERSDAGWLKYALEALQPDLDRMAGQNAQKNINLQVLEPLKIRVPPIREQKRISDVLSTWDEAITTNELLLANTCRQKQSLIHTLLNGKQRLPSYTDTWNSVVLGDVCSFHKGYGLAKVNVSQKGARACILYGELFTTYKELIDNVTSRTDSEFGFVANFGDVLIPTATTTVAMDLAKASALLVDDVAIGGDAIVIRPNQKVLLPEFLAYVLTHVKKQEIAARAQGATIVHLSVGDIDDLEISVPSVQEQRAIVAILEILTLKSKSIERDIAALTKMKQVLMQQLLMGKRRVCPPQSPAEELV